jgi:hypothetical protein
VPRDAADAAGLLNFSATTKPNRYLARLDNNRYLPAAIRIPKHPLQPVIIFEDVHILEWNSAAGEILTGSRRVGSKILSENKHYICCHNLSPA